MKDPIILYPPTDIAALWAECEQWVTNKGGLGADNPSQMMAAAGADPGCCSCPSCNEYHWAYGIIHKCPTCGFIYPTDWWKMLSWGSSSGCRDATNDITDDLRKRQKWDEKYKGHPYWEYGYKHRLENAWMFKDIIDWKAEIGDCFISGGEFRPVVDYSEQCRAVLELKEHPCSTDFLVSSRDVWVVNIEGKEWWVAKDNGELIEAINLPNGSLQYLDLTLCSLCGGKGYYMYDHNHGKPCEKCCKHAQGWWNLPESSSSYVKGADNGCCRAGCGQLRRELHQENQHQNPPKDATACCASDFAYATIEEFEEIVGYKVNEVFRNGWRMARTTNAQLGFKQNSQA